MINQNYPLKISPNHSNQKGFTLIEIMVGVAIITIVFLSAFNGLKQGFYLIENARDYTRVSQIMQSEMELLRSKNWAILSAMNTDEAFTPNTKFISKFKNRYTCNRKITTRKTGQLSITLTVSWTDQNNIGNSRKYISFFTKGGINDYYVRSF